MWSYIKSLLRDEGGWITGALIAGGMLYSAYKSSETAQQAADTQAQAANQAAQVQLEMYYQTREDLAPWREAGQWALGQPAGTTPETTTYGLPEPIREDFYGPAPGQPRNRLNQQLGPGAQPQPQQIFDEEGYNRALAEYETSKVVTPGTPYEATGLVKKIQEGPGEYEESPYYNFLLAEGTSALEKGAAAKGMQLSGAENKALMAYGQNLASTDYGNWLARYYQSLTPYQSLAGVGQTAGTQTGQFGAQAAGGQANALLQGGQAQAAGQMGAWAPYGNLMNWGGNQLLNYYMMNKLAGYGGGGGGGGGSSVATWPGYNYGIS